MEGSKFISKSKFCWADEVEKEEAKEAIKTHLHQSEKPNPFGSARPRELVLEEKGVDWRNFDKELHKPCSSPSNVIRKEKQVKEIAPPPIAPVDRKHTWSPRTRGLEQNNGSTRLGGSGNQAAGCLMLPNQDMDPLVPPLRYPPRNIMVLMKQWPSQAYNVASLLSSTVFPMERQREDSIRELGMQRSLNSKRLDTGAYRCSDLHEREVELEKGKSCMENDRSFIEKELGHQARGEMCTVRSSSVQKVISNYSGSHKLPGPLLANGRRRAAAGEFDRGNIENEYGRTDGSRKSARGLPLIRPQLNGERSGYCHLKNDEAGFNYRMLE